MSKYIPPNQRKVPKEDEFPALGAVKSTSSAWGKSFASLATEWSKKDENERIEQEIQDEIEKRRRERDELNNRHVIIRRRVDEVIVEEDVYDDTDNPTTNDEWKTVERKQRPILTTEERAMRAEAREREEKREIEESVWKDEEWDFRDRRVYT